MTHRWMITAALVLGPALYVLAPRIEPNATPADLEAQGSAPVPAAPVMIVVVKSAADVAAVREAIDPERIVANSLEGFAVREGRLVVSSVEAAGELLALAGWSEAALEIVKPESRPVLGNAAPSAGGAGARAGELNRLMSKPTLTLDEALRALQLLE